MESVREEMYSIYLMHFLNNIRFGYTNVLNQIARNASKKSDIDEIAFFQNHPNGHKMITEC